MKFVKYIITLPLNTEETKQVIFYTLEEVCEFLDINESAVFSIINGSYKFFNKKHLKGIKIVKEKIEEEKKIELKEKILGRKRIDKKKEDMIFQTELLEKYNEKLKKGEIII